MSGRQPDRHPKPRPDIQPWGMPMVYDRPEAIGPAFESKQPDRATSRIGIADRHSDAPHTRPTYGEPDGRPPVVDHRQHLPLSHRLSLAPTDRPTPSLKPPISPPSYTGATEVAARPHPWHAPTSRPLSSGLAIWRFGLHVIAA
jgi:hypothetical protein